MATTAQDQAGGRRPSLEYDGTVVVPRRVNWTERMRLIVAFATTAVAIGFVVLGFVRPAWVGFEKQQTLLFLAGPALVIAAMIHLMLVISGFRRPLATFGPQGVQIQGWSFKRAEVTRIWIERSSYAAAGPPALMVATTRPGMEMIPALPPNALAPADLDALYGRLQQLQLTQVAVG